MGRKVLLVYPYIPRAERYRGNLGVFGGRQIPLGIYSLAAYLRRFGHEVGAVDAEARGWSPTDVLAYLEAGRFDVLGISATTAVFEQATALARAVKSAHGDIPIVVGGPHVSALPLQALEEESFDYAVVGEGEETLRCLLEALEPDGELASVLGLVYRWKGEVRVNPVRPLIDDLDSIPMPAYDLIPDLRTYSPPPFTYRIRPVANVMTSRGCSGRCTFCSRATFGRRVRYRSVQSVVAEVEALVRSHGVKEIAFVDDSFLASPRRVALLCEALASRGLRVPWSCRARADQVDEAMMRFMKSQGCWHISIGIESADQCILRRIGKDITLEHVDTAISLCRRAGLVTKGYFMVGHPGETLDSMDRTIEYALSLGLDQISVTVNTPLPGTQQYRQAGEDGSFDAQDWPSFTLWRPVFVPRGLTGQLILEKQTEFFRRFYLRPGWLLRTAARCLSDWRLLAQVLRVCRDWWHAGGNATIVRSPEKSL
jgi:anaerobic magnesium-protoporphyrin IX monomethyl ester cyclase